MEVLFFAAMGWCGTKYPGWWKGPRKPQPDPWRPQPEPWYYIVLTVIGIAVGTISGLLFKDAIAESTIFAGQQMIAAGMLSLSASRIVTDLVSPMMKGRKEI